MCLFFVIFSLKSFTSSLWYLRYSCSLLGVTLAVFQALTQVYPRVKVTPKVKSHSLHLWGGWREGDCDFPPSWELGAFTSSKSPELNKGGPSSWGIISNGCFNSYWKWAMEVTCLTNSDISWSNIKSLVKIGHLYTISKGLNLHFEGVFLTHTEVIGKRVADGRWISWDNFRGGS